MSMLRRLFQQPVAIASFSPERHRIHWDTGTLGHWDERINCGEAVCPETAKTGLIDISLACSIGKLYDFVVYGIAQEVIRAKIRHSKCGLDA